jgi:hypothetical protein
MLSSRETPSATPGAVLDFLPRVPRQNKCPKLRFHVILDKSTFVAGEILYGRLELVSYSRHSLHLGEIAIELAGFEGAPIYRPDARIVYTWEEKLIFVSLVHQ